MILNSLKITEGHKKCRGWGGLSRHDMHTRRAIFSHKLYCNFINNPSLMRL